MSAGVGGIGGGRPKPQISLQLRHATTPHPSLQYGPTRPPTTNDTKRKVRFRETTKYIVNPTSKKHPQKKKRNPCIKWQNVGNHIAWEATSGHGPHFMKSQKVYVGPENPSPCQSQGGQSPTLGNWLKIEL